MTTQNGLEYSNITTAGNSSVIDPVTSATEITHTKGLYHNGIVELSAYRYTQNCQSVQRYLVA